MGREKQKETSKILFPQTFEELKTLEESYFTQSNYLVEAVFLQHFKELELKVLCLISKYINTNQFQNVPANSIQSLKESTDRVLRISISSQQFCKFLHINQMTFYQQMKNLTSLLNKSILIESIPPNKKKFIALNLFSYIGCDDGKAIFGINAALQPYLHHLRSNFTILALEYIGNMTSAYAIKIYQLLKQYEIEGQRTFTLQEMKKVLGITNTYSNDFSNFRRKVLDVAQKNINKHSDLRISFTTKNTANKIDEIIFKIVTQQNQLYQAVKIFKKEVEICLKIKKVILQTIHEKLGRHWNETNGKIENNLELFNRWITARVKDYNPTSTNNIKLNKQEEISLPVWYDHYLQDYKNLSL
jgi:plasmid replication initiation protein